MTVWRADSYCSQRLYDQVKSKEASRLILELCGVSGSLLLPLCLRKPAWTLSTHSAYISYIVFFSVSEVCNRWLILRAKMQDHIVVVAFWQLWCHFPVNYSLCWKDWVEHWNMDALSYSTGLESHHDIANCWAGDSIDEPLFLLECKEKIYLKYVTLYIVIFPLLPFKGLWACTQY